MRIQKLYWVPQKLPQIIMYLRISVLERLCDLQYIFEVIYETLCISAEILNNTNEMESIRHMVLRLDGCSFDYAHTWSKSGFSIC